MPNIDLNIGGLIGAVVCGAIVGAIVFATVNLTDSGRGPNILIILAVIGGAIAGNFLWGSFVTKRK